MVTTVILSRTTLYGGPFYVKIVIYLFVPYVAILVKVQNIMSEESRVKTCKIVNWKIAFYDYIQLSNSSVIYVYSYYSIVDKI